MNYEMVRFVFNICETSFTCGLDSLLGAIGDVCNTDRKCLDARDTVRVEAFVPEVL